MKWRFPLTRLEPGKGTMTVQEVQVYALVAIAERLEALHEDLKEVTEALEGLHSLSAEDKEQLERLAKALERGADAWYKQPEQEGN